MPCTDGGPSQEQIEEPRKLRASLCALLTQHGTRVLDGVNWREAGITREWVEGWWGEHQREDAERRKWEAAEAKRRATKATALKKLTQAERDALDLRP